MHAHAGCGCATARWLPRGADGSPGTIASGQWTAGPPQRRHVFESLVGVLIHIDPEQAAIPFMVELR